MQQTIIIISDGAPVDPAFLKKKIRETLHRLVICCDGGVRHLEKLRIKPDVIIGDMDSIRSVRLDGYAKQGVRIIPYPPDKDFTDTELALDYAMRLHPKQIFMCCATGGRLDHALANVFLLRKGRQKGVRIILMDEYCDVFLVDKEIRFVHDQGKTVSILPLSSRVSGVTLSGFLYPLQNGHLNMGDSRGLSNVITRTHAGIRVSKGNLLVIKYVKPDCYPKAV